MYIRRWRGIHGGATVAGDHDKYIENIKRQLLSK